jgi:Ca2+-binding EF-hand superfamily protein
MIKEAILVGGIAFYAFVISTLIRDIRTPLPYAGDENFSKSFLRIIDNDNDGIITTKEMKEFNTCPEYDGKKLTREFKEYGRRADLNELSEFLTPKIGTVGPMQC